MLVLIHSSQAAAVSEGEIGDAMLGRSSVDLSRHDLNKDIVVDVADLVAVARFMPEVEFGERTSLVLEGEGTIGLQIKATRAFQGPIYYSVTGSASAGGDYEDLLGPVWMNGTNATLNIGIKDDAEIEGSETMVITLSAPGDLSFALGGVSQHVVTIEDNDAIWEGTLDSGYLQIGFELSLVHGETGEQASFTSDGTGAFPPGNWPAVASLTQTRFEATIGPVPTGAARTLLQAPFSRTIHLLCEPGTTNLQDVIEWDQLISGTMLEEFLFVGETNQHLNRVGANALSGRFTLRKRSPEVVRDAPVLISIP